jgi:hypothetical protein
MEGYARFVTQMRVRCTLITSLVASPVVDMTSTTFGFSVKIATYARALSMRAFFYHDWLPPLSFLPISP